MPDQGKKSHAPSAHEQRTVTRHLHRQRKQARYAAEARAAQARQDAARQAAVKPRSPRAKVRARERRAQRQGVLAPPQRSRPASLEERHARAHLTVTRELLSLALARLAKLRARAQRRAAVT
jgi:hypothetical protein